MGKKINLVEERHELREIESRFRETMEFMMHMEEANKWKIGEDTKMRCQDFNSFSKAKMQRMIVHLDSIILATQTEFNIANIGANEYHIQMFIHLSMLMSIIDTCSNCGWKVSKNWTIK